MRIKLMTYFAVLLTVVACVSLATAKTTPAGRDTRLEAPVTHAGPAFTARSVFQGFEGAFPPAGWTVNGSNGTNTWSQLIGGVEGEYSAYIRWDSVSAQDEVLEYVHTVDVAGGESVLSFWMAGSVGQTWDLNTTETVEVDGVVVFDFDTDATVGYMVFEKYLVDLAAWDGQTVTITFRYAGVDGDAHYVDAVKIDGGTGYIPPDVEFCSLLEDVDGVGTFFGNTCNGPNLIAALGCEGFTENGLESYYEVVVGPGGSFVATVTHEADGALWIVDDCTAPGGAYNCLGWVDDAEGGTEFIGWNNVSGSEQTVYLVIDSWGEGSCGAYEMFFQGEDAVANEFKSFGEVKTLWR